MRSRYWVLDAGCSALFTGEINLKSLVANQTSQIFISQSFKETQRNTKKKFSVNLSAYLVVLCAITITH